MDAATELPPSEAEEVIITHEFGQDINTHPPPKLKRTRRERGMKLNITMDTPTELPPSEPKEVIAHEFDQDVNTHPPPKLKRTIRERGTKLNIAMDTATELQPSEAEELITHEFGQDINTQPPPKLKRKRKQIDEGVVKRIDEGVKKNTRLTLAREGYMSLGLPLPRLVQAGLYVNSYVTDTFSRLKELD